MSDSSDNEYEALRERNVALKLAMLAELGLDDVINDGKKLSSQIKEERKVRTYVRRKPVVDAVPSRRSLRIQKNSYKVKYVRGFRGFDSHVDADVSTENCEISDEASVSTRAEEGNLNKYTNKVQFSSHSKCTPSSKSTILKKEEISKVGSNFTKSEMEKNGQYEELENLACSESVDRKSNVVVNNRECQNMISDSTENNEQDATGLGNNKSLVNGISPHQEEEFVNAKNMPSVVNRNGYSHVLQNLQNHYVPWQKRSEQICVDIIMKNLQQKTDFEKIRSFNDRCVDGSERVEKHDDDDDDDWNKYENIVFYLSTSDDSDEETYQTHHRRQISHGKNSHGVPTLSCDEVTEEMLAKIAKRSSGKVYDQVNGTTCHQCRQKTIDTKTVCRSKHCVGVRGMFCGVCLPKRYGEQVSEALGNPKWECPVCRGICNCSFCRGRAGMIPTGILYPIARQEGYNCVAEYLKDRDKENKRIKEKKMKVIASSGNIL